ASGTRAGEVVSQAARQAVPAGALLGTRSIRSPTGSSIVAGLSRAAGWFLGRRHVVADPRLRKQIPRVRAVRFDLAADTLNKRPHVVGFLAVLPAPDRLKDLAVQKNLASVACEIRQHIKFASCQWHVHAVQSCA